MTDKTQREPTEADLQLEHTVFEHILNEAVFSLVIALEELSRMSDSRAEVLKEAVQAVVDQLLEMSDDVIDTIPGTLSRDEAEAKATEILERVASLASLPINALLPDKEILH